MLTLCTESTFSSTGPWLRKLTPSTLHPVYAVRFRPLALADQAAATGDISLIAQLICSNNIARMFVERGKSGPESYGLESLKYRLFKQISGHLG